MPKATAKGLFSTPRGEQASPAGSRLDMSQEKLKKAPLYGPFKPNNPPKKGYNKTLNKQPLYVEERENEREDPSALRERHLKKKHEEKIWIPNTFEWSKPCVSVNQMPTNVASKERNLF